MVHLALRTDCVLFASCYFRWCHPNKLKIFCCGGNVTHFLWGEVRRNASYSSMAITTTSVKSSDIPYDFTAVKTVAIKQMNSTAIYLRVEEWCAFNNNKPPLLVYICTNKTQERRDFLSQIVMRDETWVYQFEPWHQQATNGVMPHDNPMEDIQECVISRQRDKTCIILLKFLLRGTTVDSQHNTRNSRGLNASLYQVHPITNISEVLLLHYSTRPCSPDLIPSHFCLLDHLKDSLWGHRGVDDRVL